MLLFLLGVYRQGKKEIFSPTTPRSLPLPKPKKTQQDPHPTSCLAIEANMQRGQALGQLPTSRQTTLPL